MKLDKVTNEGTSRRWYDDACGMAYALELIGERWAPLILRELMFGPRRFSELRRGLPGLSANVLTQRLDRLEGNGVLVRRKLPPPASVQVYELTPWGYASESALCALGQWAVRSSQHDPRLPLSAASLMMSFRAMFDPTVAAGLDATIGIRVGTDSFLVRLAEGTITIQRNGFEDDGVDLVLAASEARAIAAAVYPREPLAALEASGALKLTGDRKLAERFVTLFPLPPKIA